MTDTSEVVVPDEVIPPPDAVVEKPCDEPGCDFVARGPAVGRANAGWLLGSHKFRSHGVRAGGGTGARPNARTRAKSTRKEQETSDRQARRPVTGVIQDMADEFGGRGAPSAEEIKRALGKGLGVVSIAVASYAVETDSTIPDGPEGEALRDAITDDLSLSRAAAEEIMGPIGRAFAGTKLNRRVGRRVVENVDTVGAVAELCTLGLHWRRYFRQRRLRERIMAGELGPEGVGPVGPVPPVMATPPPASAPPPPGASMPAGPTGPPPPAPDQATPPPVRGVIIDGAMVESMRRQRGG